MIGQLININVQPIRLQYEINNSHLEYETHNPQLNMKTQKGGLEIKSDRAEIKIDSFETRQEIGLKTAATLIKEMGQKSVQAGYEAVASIAEKGNMLDDPHAPSIPQMAANEMIKQYDTNIVFIPQDRPKMSVEGGNMEMSYTPDKLIFSPDMGGCEFNYVPGDVNFRVVRKPEVNIEYLGKPNYVPPELVEKLKGMMIDINI